jgi:presenilin-like A22 family membrane protease
MSKKEIVVLVSRAVAVYLTLWTLVEFTYLPSRIFSLAHHQGKVSVLATHNYWWDVDVIGLVCHVVRILILGAAALTLFTSGPRFQTFLLPIREAAETPE